MINSIIDTYHGNTIDFLTAKQAGVVAVIHKATQGIEFRDKKYHQRREEAKAEGLLWGAYHFSTGDNVIGQVENFLNHTRPDDSDLISLDWEPSDGPDMTLLQAREFVQVVKNETGRWPMIYGGHLLRSSVGHQTDEVLKNCPLWYARYASSPIGIPVATWQTYTLWQYTDGEFGMDPKETPGVSGADRNIFQGSEQELRAQWPFTQREENTAEGPGLARMRIS